jgi:DNA repair ATPase RecN
VQKGVVGDRTVTNVRCLEDREREQELAGMLGAVTKQTRASAREMFEASQADKQA